MKYTPSVLLGQLSKSAGSVTAGHNRNGSYLRTKVIPTNPRSSLTTFARGVVSAFASAWRGLTAAERLAWAALGSTMLRSDSLGNPYTLTGQQAYISVNRFIRLYGGAAVTTAPTLLIPTAITSFTVTATSV